LFGFW